MFTLDRVLMHLPDAAAVTAVDPLNTVSTIGWNPDAQIPDEVAASAIPILLDGGDPDSYLKGLLTGILACQRADMAEFETDF